MLEWPNLGVSVTNIGKTECQFSHTDNLAPSSCQALQGCCLIPRQLLQLGTIVLTISLVLTVDEHHRLHSRNIRAQKRCP